MSKKHLITKGMLPKSEFWFQVSFDRPFTDEELKFIKGCNFKILTGLDGNPEALTRENGKVTAKEGDYLHFTWPGGNAEEHFPDSYTFQEIYIKAISKRSFEQGYQIVEEYEPRNVFYADVSNVRNISEWKDSMQQWQEAMRKFQGEDKGSLS